jgi:hypothetical protein
MKELNLGQFVKMGENLSSAKIAVLLSMAEDNIDNIVVQAFTSLPDISCVITRAGGRGDNLKDKLFRNALTAAENSKVIDKSEKAKFVFFRLFSKLLNKINSGIFSISGAGFKIGIARNKKFISVAISGKIGIPGLNIDEDIIEVETDYYYSGEE